MARDSLTCSCAFGPGYGCPYLFESGFITYGTIFWRFDAFPQIGVEGFIPHDPKSRMGLIEASEVAWQVGQVNAAQRFAFVGVLSSQRCVQPRLMKRLVETYLVTGEYRAAEIY